MNLGDALKNLKEFFLEFLGYFLPGFTFIFLLGILLKKERIISLLDSFQNTEIDVNFIFIFLSYILGYIIYGFNIFVKNQSKYLVTKFPVLIGIGILNNSKNKIIEDFKGSFEYKTTKEIINTKFGKEDIDLGFNGYRNYAMSVIGDEKVQTIYTFMLRADLCCHLRIVCGIIGSLGILFSISEIFIKNNNLINHTVSHFSFYIILILGMHFFNNSYKRFVSIALRIGFSMFGH